MDLDTQREPAVQERRNAVPATVLVIAGSGLGNILLTTPLIRSIKGQWPECAIDVLVPPGRAGILEGNPDVRDVLIMAKARESGLPAYGRLLERITRAYDIAVSARDSSRSLFNAFLAAPVRYGFIRANDVRDPFCRRFAQHAQTTVHDEHVVLTHLRLADAMGIPRLPVLVPPSAGLDREAVLELVERTGGRRCARFVVVHPTPRNRYKRWRMPDWHALVVALQARGLDVILSGGPGDEEAAYVASIRGGEGCAQAIDLAGKLSLGEASDVIRHAALFVGPDTGTSHMAAATGVPTVALFGPTDPMRWGPWPAGWTGRDGPFDGGGSRQVGNVWLLQSEMPCVPCGSEGCTNQADEESRCMENITVAQVLQAVDEALGDGGRGCEAIVNEEMR